MLLLDLKMFLISDGNFRYMLKAGAQAHHNGLLPLLVSAAIVAYTRLQQIG